MTPTEAEELFSAAYDGELDAAAQLAFDEVLARDAELAKKYRDFCDTMSTALMGGQVGDVAADGSTHDTPDLLPGVQKRLRARSAGRYYADRFSEQSGKGLTGPLALALIMVALCALTWVAFTYLQGVELK